MVLEKTEKIAKMRDEHGLLLLKLFSAWACFGGLGSGAVSVLLLSGM
jgi:hypothetical protein